MNRNCGTPTPVRSAAVLFAALLLASSGLLAQQEGEEQSERVSWFSRLSFGVTMTTPVNGIIREGQTSDTDTSTSGKVTTTVVTTVKSESTLKRVGGGVALFVDLNDRFSVGTNILYRRGGYNRTTTEETTVSNDTDTETVTEKTQASYWEIPVVTHIRLAEIRPLRARVFFTGGGAVRMIRGIKTLTDYGHSDGSSDTTLVPAVADSPTTLGAVVGGGFQWQDDTGLRLTPEFRYTHWLDRAWDKNPTRSAMGQLEFLLTLTF
jgi:hypothetical protein